MSKERSRPQLAEDKSWVTTYVEDDLKRKFRVLCAEREISMAEQLAQLIAEFVRKEGK